MQDREFTPEVAPTISLREYGDILRRRRAIILQTLVIVVVAGVLITLFQTPTYQASARILVKPPGMNINLGNNSDPLANVFDNQVNYGVMTQVEILNSSDMRKKLQEKLGGQIPKFTIEPIDGTSIIVVSAEGDNPDRVSTAANTLLKEYVAVVEDREAGGLTRATQLALQNFNDANRRKTKAERDLQTFRTVNNVAEYESSLKAAQESAGRNSGNYQNTQDRLRALERQKADIQNLLGSVVKSDKLTIPSPAADPLINGLQQKISEIQIEKNQLLQMKESVPRDKLAMLDGQIKDWQAQLIQARQTFNQRNKAINPQFDNYADQLLRLDIEQHGLQAQAAQMMQAMAAANKRLSQFPAWERQHRLLQQTIKSSTANLDYWEAQLNNLNLRGKTRNPSVSIIDEAVTPTDPVRPKRSQNIMLSFVLGAFLGLCLALLQELFDDRINSPEEAERVLRLPSLGHVPLIEEEGLRMIRDISTFSPLMESYRSLRTNINFAAVGANLRTMVVTSSVPAEGKSTTVANLAMSMAMENRRVIIVDADLRRPSQHKLFKQDSSPGLTDILLGTHTLDQVLRSTGVANVSLLPAGTPPPNPAELLGSREMQRLIDQLKEISDLVLFDSPPTLAVADSVVLSSRVDGVLLVIAFGETKKANTRKAQELLARANAHVLGTVLNRMESPTNGYYYGKYYVPATIDSLSEPATISSTPPRTEETTALPSGTSDTSEGKDA
ncbi:MAG: polysaccharide biosynthesis tyrosine autokinase [Armatimonas sp.]